MTSAGRYLVMLNVLLQFFLNKSLFKHLLSVATCCAIGLFQDFLNIFLEKSPTQANPQSSTRPRPEEKHFAKIFNVVFLEQGEVHPPKDP